MGWGGGNGQDKPWKKFTIVNDFLGRVIKSPHQEENGRAAVIPTLIRSITQLDV